MNCIRYECTDTDIEIFHDSLKVLMVMDIFQAGRQDSKAILRIYFCNLKPGYDPAAVVTCHSWRAGSRRAAWRRDLRRSRGLWLGSRPPPPPVPTRSSSSSYHFTEKNEFIMSEEKCVIVFEAWYLS